MLVPLIQPRSQTLAGTSREGCHAASDIIDVQSLWNLLQYVIQYCESLRMQRACASGYLALTPACSIDSLLYCNVNFWGYVRDC